MEVYTWGSGNYGRLGLGHSGDACAPQHVSGVLNGCHVINSACGWYHSAVVTSTGEVATFGSRVTNNLGMADSSSEGSDNSDDSGASDDFGSSAGGDQGYCHGDVARISRQSRAGEERRRRGRGPSAPKQGRRCTADFVPHVLRSFPSRVTIAQVAVGSDMLSAHTLAVSRTGRLYSWGYGPACGLGSSANVSTPTLVTKFLGIGPGTSEAARIRAENNEMEPLGGFGRYSHHRYRHRVSNRQLGLQVLRPRIATVACGGGFSAVLSSEGEVFTFGLSAGGRLGFRTKFRAQLRPRRLETLDEGTLHLAAGAGFVLLCSASGKLLSWGDNTKGQLGAGHLQESHEPIQIGRACPAAFVMQAVAAGDSHSLALDSAGRAYSWGGEGGPMTGQGQPLANSLQVDAAFQFRLRSMPQWWVRPTPIRALSGVRVVQISAACLHSVALTNDGALFAWGAALQVGTSDPTGLTTSDRLESSWIPRLLAPSPKFPLVHVSSVSAGGWHSMAAANPSCAIERLAPPSVEQSDHLWRFCDGFVISEVDSGTEDEAQVLLCCAAVRARFVLPDGTTSPLWPAFSMQVQRLPLPPPPLEMTPLAEDSDEQGSSEGTLMDIITMHRERPRAITRSSKGRAEKTDNVPLVPSPHQTSDGDEAAGRARPDADESLVDSASRIRSGKFALNSDSDTPGLEGRARPLQRRVRPRAALPRPVIEFSSDSSGSDVPVHRTTGTSRGTQRPAPQPARSLGLELGHFSEAVLTALVRFLHTDSLGATELIDETHPTWQREQHLRMRPPGVGPGQDDWPHERPSWQRAAQGLLLRREVLDLRHIGNVLGFERLARLCDQLLHRIDAPGAPSLFVPQSTLRRAMRTLLQQAREVHPKDGPDTLILCGNALADKQRGRPRDTSGGRHWAHAFVLCAGCSNILDESNPGPNEADTRPTRSTSEPICFLRRCALPGSNVRFQLSLRDTASDVVSAWLRYIYVQEDLLLTWPCQEDRMENALAAERFWIELLRLAQRVGDEKLFSYAQDVLVGALSACNWAQFMLFAEQAQCRILLEAALMTGLRALQPVILDSFDVRTGLENPKNDEKEQSAAQTTPTGGDSDSSSKNPHCSVELEVERHLLALSPAKRSVELAAILALKKGSPAQFAELKQRLCKSVTTAQRVSEQLQQCVRFFDNHEKSGFRRDDRSGHARLIEVSALVAALVFFMTPSSARQFVIGSALAAIEPVNVWSSYVDWGWLAPISFGAIRVFMVNVLVAVVVGFVLWSGLRA